MCFHVHASGKSGSVHSGLTANIGSASKRFRGCTIISQRFRVHPVLIASTLLGYGDPLSTGSVPRPSRTVSPRQQPDDPAHPVSPSPVQPPNYLVQLLCVQDYLQGLQLFG